MNKLRIYAVPLTFMNTICRGELSPDVLIISSAQAEAIFLYMKLVMCLIKENKTKPFNLFKCHSGVLKKVSPSH